MCRLHRLKCAGIESMHSLGNPVILLEGCVSGISGEASGNSDMNSLWVLRNGEEGPRRQVQ